MNTTIKYNGAAGQDAFALNINQFKTGGYFLEFGSQHPTNENNTYLLESEYNWKGLMFEWEDKYVHFIRKIGQKILLILLRMLHNLIM